MPTIWECTDDDADNLTVAAHTDGYYFSIRAGLSQTPSRTTTVVIPGEKAVELAHTILGNNWQKDPPKIQPGEQGPVLGQVGDAARDAENASNELEPITTLTVAQQQRQEALGAARAALTASGLTKGTRVDDLRQLIAVAHFVAAGGRDYLLTDGEYIHRGTIAPGDVDQ